MKNLISYLRINEWLSSKVTMMLGVCVYFLYMSKTNEFSSLLEIVFYFLFVSCFLAISYIANDYSDIEVDKKAGKEKIIAKMKVWQIWLSFFVLFTVGNVPIILYCDKKAQTIALVVITYVLGLAYSTLGIRFKEKGIWGLIECSFAQRSMPLAMIGFMIPLKQVQIILLGAWMLISFLDGLRYIIIHQVVDLENDIKSGVVTYVSQKKKNYRHLLLSLLVIEVAGTTTLLIPIFINHMIISIIVVFFFILLEIGIYKVLNVFANKDWFCTFDSVPYEAFLNFGMPLLLGICSIYENIYMLFFIPCLILICYSPMRIKWNISKIYYFRNKGRGKQYGR